MIAENLHSITRKLPSGVTLVAVSKFHPVSALQEAYDAGQRDFGENRPQELAAKVPLLPADIRWHFIGHLQTNKLKLVLPYVTLVQSVDSLHLLEAIQAWAVANNRVVDVLLELHLGAEETKQGFTEEEIETLCFASSLSRELAGPSHSCGHGRPQVSEDTPSSLCIDDDTCTKSGVFCSPESQKDLLVHKNGGVLFTRSQIMPSGAQKVGCFVHQNGVRIRGLMGMATNTEDMAVVERDFAKIEALYAHIRAAYEQRPEDFPWLESFDQLSIGMSGDWPVAVRHGATMVRIGTDIFGPREY